MIQKQRGSLNTNGGTLHSDTNDELNVGMFLLIDI